MPPQDIPALREALDGTDFNAIRAGMAALRKLTPHSPDARNAASDLAETAASDRATVPSGDTTIQRLPNGRYLVHDPATGEEIGQARNRNAAARMAQRATEELNPGRGPSDDLDSPSIGDSSGTPSFAPSPLGNPFRGTDGKLAVERHPNNTENSDLAEKENEFITILNRPIEEVDAAYNAISDEHESSHGGKVISTDLPRKLLKAFADSKAGRILYTGITTAGARAYGSDRLWREIHNRGSRKKLMFTAGGIAAGKSSVVTDEVIAEQDLVYDATLRETKWAIQNIEKAIEQGWEIQIVYVQRPIDLALKGAIDRANKQGRSFPLADLPAAHQDAQRSILEIARHFKGNASVQIDLWLNSGTNREAPTPLKISQIDKGGKYSYEQHHDSRGTQSLARSNSQSSDQRIPKSSASRASILDAFREAVRREDLSTELLSRLAGKDQELLGILRKERTDFIAPRDAKDDSEER